jgi:hypothetical protein
MSSGNKYLAHGLDGIFPLSIIHIYRERRRSELADTSQIISPPSSKTAIDTRIGDKNILLSTHSTRRRAGRDIRRNGNSTELFMAGHLGNIQD